MNGLIIHRGIGSILLKSTFCATKLLSTIKPQTPIFSTARMFSALHAMCPLLGISSLKSVNFKSLLAVKDVCSVCPTRTVTKFSLKSGKKKTVRAVVHRFYRLETGQWIRRFGGYRKQKYLKSDKVLYYGDQHVFCNKQQSLMFDKMVTDFWKKKTYYIDDPFEPYKVRHNFDNDYPYKRK